MTHLLLTVRFLDDRYHGLLDRGGPPEWPPSPFRLFQALVAGVGRRGELDSPIGQSLAWLQRLGPPIIIAPKHKVGQAITRFVPNNDGDDEFDRQKRLTSKHTEPTLFLLEPDEKPEVHYAWDISSKPACPEEDIDRAARSLTALGWGIDMAFAGARIADESALQNLKGVRWYPKPGAWREQGMLRTPTYDMETNECTLCDLRHCYSTFTSRIEHGKPLKTVEKPKVFDRILYTSVARPIGRPWAAFRLVDKNGDMVRCPHATLCHVAGMVRHAAIEKMKRDAPPGHRGDAKWLETFVCGHRGDANQAHRQLSYIPLPSIGTEHADAMIRNVMVVAPFDGEYEVEYLAERLDGEELSPESAVEHCDPESKLASPSHIFLERFRPPRGRFIDNCYLGRSETWQTMTPVILDGYNRKTKTDKPDVIAERTRELIRRALARAGVEAPCEFEWQSIPFYRHALSAHKYDRNGRHTGYHRPAHLKNQTAVHVRIRFGRREEPDNMESRWIPADVPIPGPLTIGAGRHCGFGLFAAVQ